MLINGVVVSKWSARPRVEVGAGSESTGKRSAGKQRAFTRVRGEEFTGGKRRHGEGGGGVGGQNQLQWAAAEVGSCSPKRKTITQRLRTQGPFRSMPH
jgi:hypothetical protein